MKVCSEKNLTEMNRILSHKDVWEGTIDDNCNEDIRYKQAEQLLNGFISLMPNDDCLFVFRPLNSILLEGHMNVHPDGRGKTAIEAGKETLSWLFENTKFRKIIGLTPTYNKAAIRFAILIGMEREGVISNSWLKNGVLYDQVVTGINK